MVTFTECLDYDLKEYWIVHFSTIYIARKNRFRLSNQFMTRKVVYLYRQWVLIITIHIVTLKNS